MIDSQNIHPLERSLIPDFQLTSLTSEDATNVMEREFSVEHITPIMKSDNLKSALGYWLSLCDGKDIPTRKHLKPRDMVPILPYVAILENFPTGEVCLRLQGTWYSEIYQKDLTGSYFHEELNSVYDDYIRRHTKNFPEPRIVLEYSPVQKLERNHVFVQFICLPLKPLPGEPPCTFLCGDYLKEGVYDVVTDDTHLKKGNFQIETI